MTIFWFLMVALVLGGLLASLWYQENRCGNWSWKVRMPAFALAPAAALSRGRGARRALRRSGIGFLAPPGAARQAVSREATRLGGQRRRACYDDFLRLR
jgi:hypothetical protein